MEKSQSLQMYRSADGHWKTLDDVARGRRRVRLDGLGRVREVIQADGRRLHLGYDAVGALRLLEGEGGFSLSLDPAPCDATLAVTDPRGRTAFTLGLGGRRRELRRGGEYLSIELDREERLRRVTIPGSSRTLLYEWHGDGSCEIGSGEGQWTLCLTGAGAARRLEIAPGLGWEEKVVPTGVRLAPFHNGMEQLLDVRIGLDSRGRTMTRTWGNGERELFERDKQERLVRWERLGVGGEQFLWTEYHYRGAHLVETIGPEGKTVRLLDEAGRVQGLLRPDGSRVDYRYDPCGRRTERREGGRRLRYHYDQLGQLRRVTGYPAGNFELEYDGMGRRILLHRPDRLVHEHRDEAGRLWAVTDSSGRAVHTFIWVGDRLVARLDGPVGAPVAEGYLCDPLGIMLAVLRPDGQGGAGGILEQSTASPYGSIGEEGRPTLFGHFGTPEMGLIHFGARDLDPELGLFLTPDPWYGGEDDPRRWAGASEAILRREREVPGAGMHDYALCQFDPVGRSDRDGHVSAGDVFVHFLRWLLLPTWGMPLTSISLFFFMPLNLYMEVIGLIVWLFKQLPCIGDHSHPWGNHTLAKATLLLGSVRQFTFSFGLNGFLPRVIAGQGLSSDRAVTIGNVIWINREELARMDRPEVIELWDIAGSPSSGAGFNADIGKESVLGIFGIDKLGQKKLHVSAWTRGFGNAVAMVGGQQTFVDEPVPAGTAFALGTLLLRRCLPGDFPCPSDEADKERLEVEEYLFTQGTSAASEGEPIVDAWFALRLPKDTGFAVGDWLQVTAPKASPVPDPTFCEIREIVQGDEYATALLRHDLPARFSTSRLKEKLKVQKAEQEARKVVSEGWLKVTGLPPGTAPTLEVVLPVPPAPAPAGWPPILRRESTVHMVAASGVVLAVPVGGTPGAAEDTAFAKVKSVQVTLQLNPAPDPASTPTDIFLQRPAGTFFRGEVEAISPGKILYQGAQQQIATGDLLLVTRTGSAEMACLRVVAATDTELTVDPLLSPALTLAGKTRVRLQKYVDSNARKDQGRLTALSGDEIVVELDRSNLFPENSLVRYEVNGDPVLSKIGTLKKVRIELTDEAIGNPPFMVSTARLVEGGSLGDIRLAPAGCFICWTGVGTAPSTYGSYPATLLGVGYGTFIEFLDMSVFYSKWNGARPGDFHKDFRRSWWPALADGKEYWVLETPLPLAEREDNNTTLNYIWSADEETDDLDINLGAVSAGPPKFKIREYTQSGVKRSDSAGRRVLGRPPEVQVPINPRLHDTHRRALIEHETHHTVQGNFWGPLMGALPLQGIIMSVTDIIQATGSDSIPDWLKGVELDAQGNPPATADGRIDHNTELNPFEVVSIGGLMQLVWKYVILGPLLPFDDLRDKIIPLDFSSWNKVFNPLNRLLMDALPPVDPNASPKDRWPAALGQLVERAVDLRSWTPFLGFIPTLLPDGPRSFIEQGASQASGDLYSTILSANDRFNRVSKFVGTSYNRKKADLHPRLGEAVRLMLFAGYRTDRLFAAGHGNRPGSPLTYQQTIRVEEPLVLSLPIAGSTALVHPALYEVRPAAGGPVPSHAVEGPPPVRALVSFLYAFTGDKILPRLRSLVPTPPPVNRSCGFYFLPASHGQIRIDGYYAAAGAGDQDAETQTVVLTVADEVKLGENAVAWSLPPVHPATPTISIDRFVTEKHVLKMTGSHIGGMVIVLDQPAGGPFVFETSRMDHLGWDLQVGAKVPVDPVRVRLYRVFTRDDQAFDLTYDDVPTLSGVRSYLDDAVWIPVRDFHLKVQPLPVLADVEEFYDKVFQLKTPIRPVAGERGITIISPAGFPQPHKRRTGDSPPRGDSWELGPLDNPVEDNVVFRVRVTYGQAPHTADQTFRLTFKPRIQLLNHVVGGAFEADKDHPLKLDIVGGTAPYRVDAVNLPDNSSVAVIDGNRVLITVHQPPDADHRVLVTVRDGADHEGTRTTILKH